MCKDNLVIKLIGVIRNFRPFTTSDNFVFVLSHIDTFGNKYQKAEINHICFPGMYFLFFPHKCPFKWEVNFKPLLWYMLK